MALCGAICLAFSVVACNEAEKEDENEPWNVLKMALEDLQRENFQNYLAFVDSTQITSKNEEMINNALKQKFTKEKKNVSARFSLSKINMLTEDTAEVYFTTITASNDTLYSLQRMRKVNDTWKILLF